MKRLNLFATMLLICLGVLAQNVSSDSSAANPYVLLGDLAFTSPQTAVDLAKQDSLKMVSSAPYHITHFKLITARKKAPAQLWSFSSPKLSKRCKLALAELSTGDRVIIEAIKAELVVGDTTFKANLSPIVYNVR